MTARSVVVLDYGSGNLRSAQRALERVGADVAVTSDRAAALAADGLVVPGVGAFEACMSGLRAINGDGIIGIDLDNAFANGKLKDWAQAIVNVFADTYMELSPSGNGIHIIAKAEVFSGRRFTVADGGIEIYATGRYFTMTGKRFNRSPKKLKKFDDPVSSVINIIDSVNLSGAINS